MDSLLKSRVLLVRCPKLSTCSPIVASVLEQAVLEFAKYQSAIPADMGRPQGLYKDWVTSKIDEFLDPPFGGAQLGAADWSYLGQCRVQYCTEVVDWIDEIVRLNADTLLDHDGFKPKTARVVRRFPDLWIIELRG